MSGKSFHFSLDSVLQLRKHETEMVRRRLQDAAAALRRAEHAAEQAENVLSDRIQADLPAGAGGVASFQRLAGFREDARRKLNEAKRKIEVLSAREEETRRELVLRRQEEESLEQLYQEEKAAFEKTQEEAEMAFLDEQAVTTYNRQRSAQR